MNHQPTSNNDPHSQSPADVSSYGALRDKVHQMLDVAADIVVSDSNARGVSSEKVPPTKAASGVGADTRLSGLGEGKQGLPKRLEDTLKILKLVDGDQLKQSGPVPETAEPNVGIAAGGGTAPSTENLEQNSTAQGNDSNDGDDDGDVDDIMTFDFDDDTICTTFTHRQLQAQQERIVLENIPYIPDVEAATIGKGDLEAMEKKELIDMIDALMGKNKAVQIPPSNVDRDVTEKHDERTQHSFKVMLPPWLQKSTGKKELIINGVPEASINIGMLQQQATAHDNSYHASTQETAPTKEPLNAPGNVELPTTQQPAFEPVLPPWLNQKSKEGQPSKKEASESHPDRSTSASNMQQPKELSEQVYQAESAATENILPSQQKSSGTPEKAEIPTPSNTVPNVLPQPKESPKQTLATSSLRKAAAAPSKLVPISENEQVSEETVSYWDRHIPSENIPEPKRSSTWRRGVVKFKSKRKQVASDNTNNNNNNNNKSTNTTKNVQALFYTPGTAEGVFLLKVESSLSSRRLEQINAMWDKHYNADASSSGSTVSLTDHSSS